MAQRYLRQGRRRKAEPREVRTEYVPRTEHEEARRANLDWLRDREEGDELFDWAVGNGWE
jgi:hypothetical protein